MNSALVAVFIAAASALSVPSVADTNINEIVDNGFARLNLETKKTGGFIVSSTNISDGKVGDHYVRSVWMGDLSTLTRVGDWTATDPYPYGNYTASGNFELGVYQYWGVDLAPDDTLTTLVVPVNGHEFSITADVDQWGCTASTPYLSLNTYESECDLFGIPQKSYFQDHFSEYHDIVASTWRIAYETAFNAHLNKALRYIFLSCN